MSFLKSSLFCILSVLFCSAVFAGDKAQVSKLRVLMVGNSFSNSVLTFLPAIAAADPTVELSIRNAYIGGCSIQRHLAEYDKSGEKPDHRPYVVNVSIPGRNDKRASLQECLTDGEYDIVSIQQASPLSWKIESYGADARRLIEIIKKHQPKAEIIGHQTWSYRIDNANIRPNGRFKVDQKQMQDKITECYRALEKEYGFRIVPVGNAVQAYRDAAKKPDEALMAKKPVYPEKPYQPDDVVGSSGWRLNKKTGKQEVRSDTIHLNRRGCYVQGCVWYMFLFGKKAADVKFVPKNFDAADAAYLAGCAEKGISSW